MSKYPILYKGDATDFFTLGLGPIQMLKATVTQERNGIFIFEGEILTDSPLFPLVLENYIIKADADHLLKNQRFRIKRIVPNHNGKAEIYAEHVSYLSRELTIKPEVSITGSAQIALSQWKASIVEANPFVVDSDIPTSNKTKWRIDKVENPRMALGGVEGSILDIWGGEYCFDNYHISLLQKRGTTAKTVLAYGRNITDFEQERNIANTYTSIAPYAIYTDDKENEVVVHVDGYAVDSQHVNKYPNRVTLPVDFSSDFGHDEVPTKARLLTLANQYIKANEIGVPSTSIKVSFVDLSKSADYAEYAFLEQVNLCDDVRVYYPKLGVNTVAKVIRTVWNVLTESYDEIEIGQKRMSLVGQMQEQQKAIKEINTQTNYAMTSADGKNTIFHGLYGENGLGEPTAIKVGDTWFKPNGTGTDILTWTGTVWQLVFDAKTFDDIGIKVDEMEQDIIDATEKAQSGLDKAEEAILKAGFANDAVDIAVEQSADAVTRAQQAQQSANDLLGQVTTIEGTLTTVESVIDELNGQMALKVNTIDFNTLTGIVNSHTTQIGVNSGQIALKANKDYVDTINNQVESVYSELTVQAGEITTLNSKTDGHTTQIGSLESSFSGLNSTVAEVKQDLDGLDIGQRNLLIGTKKLVDSFSPKVEYKGEMYSEYPYNWTFHFNVDLKEGQKYTIQVPMYNANDSMSKARIAVSGTGGNIINIYADMSPKSYRLWTYTFTAKVTEKNIPIRFLTSSGFPNVAWQYPMMVEGNKVNGWSPAPEDMVTVEKFSVFEQNVNGFQQTTSDNITGLQSQQTQLAGQITSVITASDIAARIGTGEILTTDPTFLTSTNGLVTYNNIGTAVTMIREHQPSGSQPSGSPYRIKVITTGEASPNWGGVVRQEKSRANATFAVKFTAMLPTGRKFVPNNNSIGSGGTNEWITSNEGTGGWSEYLYIVKCGASGSFSSFGHLSVTGGSVPTQTNPLTWWISSYEMIDLSKSNQSQITQLIDSINLRVEKNNVISQINLSTEGVLIQGKNIWLDGNTKINDAVIKTAHIADLAVSGAKIANASISSAKIISLDASKITANTLSAITTNTGALNVSGWLTTTTENYGFRGTYNYGDELYGAYNPRWFDGDYRLSHRYLTFQANVYDVNSNNTRGAFKYYGETFYGADYLKLRQYTSSTNKTIRARVDVTADSIIIGPNFNGSQSIILNSNATSFFAKDASFADGITVNSQNQDGVRTGRINAPMNYNTLILNNNRNLGTLELGYDTSRYLRAKDVYDRTYSLASNMIVTNEGTLGRATSARKYKTNIVELKEIYSKAKDVLQIQPVTWLDKRALIETGTEQRGYGFIADEFHELGLTEVVQYGADGQVEGLAYDRISMYHNVILSDHEKEIIDLKQRVSELENQVRVLQMAS